MTDRIRISPLDGTMERGGVSVRFDRTNMLVAELFVLSPGRLITPRDVAMRVGGRHRKFTGRSYVSNLVSNANRGLKTLGMSIEPVNGSGWQVREGE